MAEKVNKIDFIKSIFQEILLFIIKQTSGFELVQKPFTIDEFQKKMARQTSSKRLSYCNGNPDVNRWINFRFCLQHRCFVALFLYCYDAKRKLQDGCNLQRHHDCFHWPSLGDCNGWGNDYTFFWWLSRFSGSAKCHLSRLLADDSTLWNIVSVGLVAIHRDPDGQISCLLYTLSNGRQLIWVH